MSQQQTLLLTGSTGTIGKLLIQQLHSTKQEAHLKLKLLVRNVEKAKELFDALQSDSFQLEYIQGDLPINDKSVNTELLFDKVEKIFILAPDVPQKVNLEKSIVEKALQYTKASNGQLKQVVKLSALGVSRDRETNNLLRWHADSEYEIFQALNHYNEVNSDNTVSHVFIRPGMFMQNILGGYEHYYLMNHNMIVRPDLNTRHSYTTSFVDVRDLVKIISLVLLETDVTKYGDKTFTITGPSTTTNQEFVEIVSKVLKRDIHYEKVSEFTFMNMLKEMQIPNDYIWMLIKLYQTGKENGAASIIYEDFENITGTSPTTFEQFLLDHLSYFNQ
ncbi:hypothetical protein NAEGRDRAFT_57317 [Naegleria gruberi]|uniref:NmrA-like domain-containing protein n=1 Tax=Naegleria gruberi TaxID=5762 RepID=D2V6T3_NAEGR|nr:uncharacterized protein NAEGRDRAFT_57317 [Naegleria gruberi]EFC47498.1 hypothetical protein NAEGRDRAFT_57317 [Naegleria gruberi]|eukprot:XP_002680242.1 hypothetical protein NAEGRDRAFT_57317 [Naegleria gruberi strain NEG-M]